MTDMWIFEAACGLGDADNLFVEGAEQNAAKQICETCPVRCECLVTALDNHISTGVWGGMTERERRALLRRNPHVSSWRTIVEAASPPVPRRRDGRTNGNGTRPAKPADGRGDGLPVVAGGRPQGVRYTV